MKKTATAILMGLSLVAITPNANAQIASQAYVDQQDSAILNGTGTTQEKSTMYTNLGINDSMVTQVDGMVEVVGVNSLLATLANSSASASDLDKTVGRAYQAGNGILVTDNDGKVSVATGGYITNNKVSSSAAIEMGKIAFPAAPASCNTTGCMLMYYNGQYTWESIARDTSETVSVVSANAVSATATATSTNTVAVNPASCQRNGGTWNESTGQCDVVH